MTRDGSGGDDVVVFLFRVLVLLLACWIQFILGFVRLFWYETTTLNMP